MFDTLSGFVTRVTVPLSGGKRQSKAEGPTSNVLSTRPGEKPR